jgi:hypothetical protein
VTSAPFSFDPVARNDYLDRLALPPEPLLAPAFWDEVHEEVQGPLTQLETALRQKLPGVRGSVGHTRGEHFLLFSYRTFAMPALDTDPLVAGITFTLGDQGVRVEGDVSGEQTGDYIASVPGETVGASRDDILAAGRNVAERLVKSVDEIAAALNDASRTVE